MDDDIVKEIQKQYEYINFVSEEKKEKEEKSLCILAKICYARQKIESLKLATIIELCKEKLENKFSVVVFVNFLDSLKILAKEFKVENVICGNQSLETRQKIVDDFQSNKEKIILCQIQSGGQAISLHDIHGNHPRVSIISPGWSSKDIYQAIGRIYRAEGKTPCLQYLVYCANTIEVQICEIIQKKFHNYSLLTSGEESHYSIIQG